ncbi:MAG: G1 family glutamic endopeptidase [Rhodospirillales bacterium]
MTRVGRCGLACVVAALVPGSALARPPALVATNLPGVFAYAAPPAGFDVFTASPEGLAAYGYPPRPARASGRDYQMWARAMRAERRRIIPFLQQSDLAAGSALDARGGLRGASSTSRNWSAAVIVNNAVRYGTGSFHSAASWFNVPAANQAVGACTGNWDHLFSWVGLDGWRNNEVFQAGTESDAYCAGGQTQQFYSAWYEWFPSLSVRITNLPVSAGDAMIVWMVASSSTSGSAYIGNVTNGTVVGINFTAPAGTVLVGNSAEWVQERPYWNGVLSTLTNYGGAWMSTEGAQILGNNSVFTFGNPGGATPLLVTMLDNGGHAISFPTQLGADGTVFEDEGSAK